MGFRNDSYASVFSVKPVSDAMTRGNICISRKNRQTGNYEQDFSGFVTFIGTEVAKKAAQLKCEKTKPARIKLGQVDVSTYYDREKQKEYVNYKVFSFDVAGENNSTPIQASPVQTSDPEPAGVDDGEIDDSELPF